MACLIAPNGLCRERNDGMYRSLTYLVAKMTEELVAAFIASMIFACLVFFPLKLAGSFGLFFCVYYMTTCIGIGKCPCLSILC